jgi:hypothetical protein
LPEWEHISASSTQARAAPSLAKEAGLTCTEINFLSLGVRLAETAARYCFASSAIVGADPELLEMIPSQIFHTELLQIWPLSREIGDIIESKDSN